ncbi:MAG TPA: hypothetical protein VFS20_06290 [Longimicrobium sp.]|nr:hypothetical protein [Longimicrobium sp.]
MLLLAHGIRLAQPAAHIVVDLGGVAQAEVVHVVARRQRVDAGEARMLQPADGRCSLRADEQFATRLWRDERVAIPRPVG